MASLSDIRMRLRRKMEDGWCCLACGDSGRITLMAVTRPNDFSTSVESSETPCPNCGEGNPKNTSYWPHFHKFTCGHKLYVTRNIHDARVLLEHAVKSGEPSNLLLSPSTNQFAKFTRCSMIMGDRHEPSWMLMLSHNIPEFTIPDKYLVHIGQQQLFIYEVSKAAYTEVDEIVPRVPKSCMRSVLKDPFSTQIWEAATNLTWRYVGPMGTDGRLWKSSNGITIAHR